MVVFMQKPTMNTALLCLDVDMVGFCAVLKVGSSPTYSRSDLRMVGSCGTYRGFMYV